MVIILDTKYDYIRAEFLNILFFQQKSVVIFPYVDIKHLRILEVFAIGYNVVDLDSTAIHNLKEILELDRYNYSQNPSFFFIINVNKEQLKEIMEVEHVHCIINCNEDVKEYSNESPFVFFNKKSYSFINYNPSDLNFEEELINSSKNISILQDKILKIKTLATNIYTELNENGHIREIIPLLSAFTSEYWEKILQYTQLYYNIEIPTIPKSEFPSDQSKSKEQKEELLDSSFENEYLVIVGTNKYIGKEFIQLMFDWKHRINLSNLDMVQLRYPEELYDYFRNRHWNKAIDERFLQEWVQMNRTKYQLIDSDIVDFEKIFQFLGAPLSIIAENMPVSISKSSLNSSQDLKMAELPKKSPPPMVTHAKIPSIKKFQKFKAWICDNLLQVEKQINSNLGTEEIERITPELLAIIDLIHSKKKKLANPLLIDKISDEKVKTILSTAEDMFSTYKKKEILANDKFDASPITNQYCKGLEIMFRYKLSVHFNALIAKYRKKFKQKETSIEFNKKFGNLMRNRTINVGVWGAILEDVDKTNVPSDIHEFLTVLRMKFDPSALNLFKKACKFIGPFRNRGSHETIYTIEQVKEMRQKFIQVLNPVIKVLY